MVSRLPARRPVESPAERAYRLGLVARMTFEITPLKTADGRDSGPTRRVNSLGDVFPGERASRPPRP